MVLITATVRRQGPGAAKEHDEVPIEQLVPGDIVLLSAGDMIPADVRLISAKDLFVNQSTLTGEAMPLEKNAQPHAGAAETPFDLPNICFMGSVVVSGVGSGVVVLTGARTAFGQVAGAIAERRVLTSFDKGITRITWMMIGLIAIMAPLVFLINGLSKGNWFEALLFAVAVAVGLTPEMLPMIVTVNLAKGAMAMSKKKVIVKRLNAIQNFGAMDVLCTDKTGTLTQDLVVLKRHLDLHGEDSDRVLEYAYLNSLYQSGLKNLLDVAVLKHVELDEKLKVEERFSKIDEIPFDFERRRMSVVLKRGDDAHILICKGAVEEIFAVCTRYADQQRDRRARPEPLRPGQGDDGQAQRGRISRDRRRFQGNAAGAGGLFRRGRGRPHIAWLYRVPRPAEGDRRSGHCHAEGPWRAGEDPDRRQ